MKKGLMIIYSGPSGVGKGTVREEFITDPDLNLVYSISMTTRKPRQNEVDGVDYFFVTEEEFKRAIEEDELLEYAQFVGNYYGTPKAYVDKKRNEGFNVIMEIEVEGAKQVMKNAEDYLSIFLLPPSMKELECRIRNRKTEPEEIVQKRLNKALSELEVKKEYQYSVINETAQQAALEITEIIKNTIDSLE